MTLILSVLRCPDAVPPETRRLPGGEYTIGRGSDADWPLADPGRVLSKRHCTLEFRSGSWQVRDTSTNGTFHNRQAEPIGQGRVCDLRDGDRLRLGAYELEVRIEEPEAWAPPSAAARSAQHRHEAFDDPMFGGAAPEREPFGAPHASHTPPIRRADDISLGLGGPSEGKLLSDDFESDLDPLQGGPTQPDHAAPGEQAFSPPRPAQTLLPDDDWLAPVIATSPATPPAATGSPFVEADDLPPAPAPWSSAARAPQGDDLLASFLRGAKIKDAHPADPVATMTALGAAFRAMVVGLREVMVARATIKGEFRIEQTMVRARGNNPLKFSAGDDDALLALLGAGRRSEVTPEQAVADSLRDIRAHELATMAAMQHAVRALLARLDPAPLRAEAEKAGALLASQKRARAFDAYERLHAEIAAALADDFDRVFGKAFARAYEQALSEVAGRERP